MGYLKLFSSNLVLVLMVLSIRMTSSSAEELAIESQTNNSTTIFTVSTLHTTPSTPSPSVNPRCQSNSSCSDCVSDLGCAYCTDLKKCVPYTIPAPSECKGNFKYGTCFMNIWIIVGSVAAALILLIVLVCSLCCCCCRSKDSKLQREWANWEKKRSDRRQAGEEKRREREAKLDDIRRKYGIGSNSNNSYKRFE